MGGLILGVGLAAIGTALGAVGSQALDDPAAVQLPAATPAVTGEHIGAAGAPTCSIYDVPSLASTIVPPRSTLADGSAYVIVCTDFAGREVFNEVFIHHLDG